MISSATSSDPVDGPAAVSDENDITWTACHRGCRCSDRIVADYSLCDASPATQQSDHGSRRTSSRSAGNGVATASEHIPRQRFNGRRNCELNVVSLLEDINPPINNKCVAPLVETISPPLKQEMVAS